VQFRKDFYGAKPIIQRRSHGLSWRGGGILTASMVAMSLLLLRAQRLRNYYGRTAVAEDDV
jgi:hypothetical protein